MKSHPSLKFDILELEVDWIGANFDRELRAPAGVFAGVRGRVRFVSRVRSFG